MAALILGNPHVVQPRRNRVAERCIQQAWPWVSRECNLSFSQRFQVPNNWVLGFWVVVIIVQVLGKCSIITYLEPSGIQKPKTNVLLPFLRSSLVGIG